MRYRLRAHPGTAQDAVAVAVQPRLPGLCGGNAAPLGLVVGCDLYRALP